MKRVIETLLLLLMVPGFGWAEPSQSNWGNLKQVVPGQQIRIVLNDAKSYTGQFQSASDEGLVVSTGGTDQTFERQNVLRVSTKGASHRGRNALIGAGIGGGFGAAVGGASDPKQEVLPGGAVAAAALGVVFGATGAVVGAVIPTGRWHDVYRAR
jgi:hypothetical protein